MRVIRILVVESRVTATELQLENKLKKQVNFQSICWLFSSVNVGKWWKNVDECFRKSKMMS